MMFCQPQLRFGWQKLNQFSGHLLNSARKLLFPKGLMYLVTTIQRPVYPSSKPKRVDWDKLEVQVKKEEKDEKLDGDAALNKFFRDIYQDADEDTRRAMKKIFCGVKWDSAFDKLKKVGAKKVVGSPPDGMEMKKWEY